MTRIRINQAAALLGVSDDTIRRWIDEGRLQATSADGGPMTIDGAELAEHAVAHAEALPLHRIDSARQTRSARNHLTGLVSRVISDPVMSQVELQCGPFRVVSLISTEAVNELGLEPGVVAHAVVKATNVTVETERGRS